jgi:hypothetical protein
LIGDRVDRFRCRAGGDDINLFLKNQIFCDLRRTIGIGLTIAQHNLQRMPCPTQVNLTAAISFDLLNNPGHLLRENRKRPGLRHNQPDLDRSRHGKGGAAEGRDHAGGTDTLERTAASHA